MLRNVRAPAADPHVDGVLCLENLRKRHKLLSKEHLLLGPIHPLPPRLSSPQVGHKDRDVTSQRGKGIFWAKTCLIFLNGGCLKG